MAYDEREIEEAFPPFKTISCMFCGTSLRLIRRGHVTVEGWPKFYYVEKGWADDFRNHACKDIDTVKTQPKPERKQSAPRMAPVPTGPGTLFEKKSTTP